MQRRLRFIYSNDNPGRSDNLHKMPSEVRLEILIKLGSVKIATI